ncbi:hypothetical protein P9112_010139 [Eukaryota sp. TZLM1-RC]
MAVARRIRVHPRTLVCAYYLVVNFRETYKGEFFPVNYQLDIDSVDEDIFLPLDTVMPGRPPVSRKDKYSRLKRFIRKRFDEGEDESDELDSEKEVEEPVPPTESSPLSPRRCGHCHVHGHDRRNCHEWKALQRQEEPTYQSEPARRTRRCRVCKEEGHDKRNCPQR